MVPKGWRGGKLGDFAAINVARDLVEGAFSPVRTDTHIYPIYSNTVENKGLYGYYNFAEFTGDYVTVVGRGIGLARAFPRVNSNFGAIGRLLVLSPKNASFDPYFLSEYVNLRLRVFHESGGIPQLPGTSLAGYYVVLPPIGEQRKIGQIASAWDSSIELAEKLLENSQTQMKGLMQQLLSGRKRLPGFTEPWHANSVSKIADIQTGESNREDSAIAGPYTFFDRSTDSRRSDKFIFDTEAVIVAGEGQEFVPRYFSGKFDLHQRTYCLSNFKGSSARYVYHYVNFKRHLLKRYSVGSTVSSLRMSTFDRLIVSLPSDDEQRAIVNVLDTAECQTTLLKEHISLLRDQKLALMQQLLTGKRRVTNGEEKAA
jgi:type I restriction enzyme, S subunit